ncbi:hypothetical protein E2C01_062671 [Portunus trituberculatus]|uniref:Uncharacterized protein n=1 Tax=Portunus trituberculatus TaxID=210409 RepID=A0A5B7HFB4_PORTR|nr:hypothetical protein [Portunus trituberculatus]
MHQSRASSHRLSGAPGRPLSSDASDKGQFLSSRYIRAAAGVMAGVDELRCAPVKEGILKLNIVAANRYQSMSLQQRPQSFKAELETHSRLATLIYAHSYPDTLDRTS